MLWDKARNSKVIQLVIQRQMMMPMCILSVLAAGSIYSTLNDHYLLTYDYKWLTTTHIDWYRFLVNASVMIGYLPAYLNEKWGPKKTFGLGAILLTVAQILAMLLLSSGETESKL
jgi:hypothetical protein